MELPVPKGPLAVRWRGVELPELRAGASAPAVVMLENAGTATWRSDPDAGVNLAYHWLDGLGNPIVWDGRRTELGRPVAPGEALRVEAGLQGPIPPGRYRLAFDLVAEGRCWFAELGNAPLERDVEVRPRIGRALAARGGDADALDAQDEPLVPEDEAEAVAYLADGIAPPPDWSRQVLDAHQEGYAVVAGSVAAEVGRLRRRPRELEPYAPGVGRVPGFPHPLLCPSVVKGVELEWTDDVARLPAARPPTDEPWVYDGRIVLRAPRRSGRPRA
jgi:hypothetical protein